MLGEHDLDDLTALMELPHPDEAFYGRQVADVLRLGVTTLAERTGNVYVCRERAPSRPGVLLRRWLGGHRRADVATERSILTHLREQGVWVPEPIAHVAGNRPPRQSALVLLDLRDSLPDLKESGPNGKPHGAERHHAQSHVAASPLADWLRLHQSDSLASRRGDIMRRLGVWLARLHTAGVRHGRLDGYRVFVADDSDVERLGFVDFREAQRSGKSLSVRQRTGEFARLWASMPPEILSDRERALAIDAYAEASGLNVAPEVFAAHVNNWQRRFLRDQSVRELRCRATQLHPPPRHSRLVFSQGMWAASDHLGELRRNGLVTFGDMMAHCEARLLRALPDRENWRLELETETGPPRIGYLKKHHVRTTASRLRARLGWGCGRTAAWTEAANIDRLARGGLAGMKLLAFGEKLHVDGRLEALLLTEELTGFAQLDHFLRERFRPRRMDRPSRRDDSLHRLIAEVADVASRFHGLGYNHRDLYCCHFFIRETDDGEFRVNLIDLQRVEHRRRFRRRWLVKDLAQLAYSAPTDRISGLQRLAFIKRYLGVKRLRSEDKRFIRQIVAKWRKMERHLGPHP
jgi:hypothetical protein